MLKAPLSRRERQIMEIVYRRERGERRRDPGRPARSTELLRSTRTSPHPGREAAPAASRGRPALRLFARCHARKGKVEGCRRSPGHFFRWLGRPGGGRLAWVVAPQAEHGRTGRTRCVDRRGAEQGALTVLEIIHCGRHCIENDLLAPRRRVLRPGRWQDRTSAFRHALWTGTLLLSALMPIAVLTLPSLAVIPASWMLPETIEAASSAVCTCRHFNARRLVLRLETVVVRRTDPADPPRHLPGRPDPLATQGPAAPVRSMG